MKLKWLFKKAFKKRNYSDSVLTTLNGVYKIPNEKYFDKYPEDFHLINDYKKEYKDTLKINNTITTIDIEASKYYQDMQMYIELITRICYKADEINNNPLEKKVSVEKLNLYSEDIKTLEKEVVARIIALKKLREEYFLHRKKQKTIEDEIENLTNSYVLLTSQKAAIAMEVFNFKMRLIDDELVEEKDLKRTYGKVNSLHKAIFNKNVSKEKNALSIAKMEHNLEKWVWKNKSELENLEEELKLLDCSKKDGNNKRSLLEKIKIIEKKYIVFKNYGRRLITEEMLQHLYKVKFDILTCALMSNNSLYSLNPNELDEYEKKCYLNIIVEKLSKIQNGTNPFFKHLFGDDVSIAIKLLVNYFKNFNLTPLSMADRINLVLKKTLFGSEVEKESNNYRPEEIMNDALTLNLLISLESENGLDKLFDFPFINRNKLVKSEKYNPNQIYFLTLNKWDEDCFEWEDKVSLNSAFRMVELSSLENYSRTYLYDFWSFASKKFEDKNIFKIPEGIKKIYKISENDLIFSKLRANCEHKKVIFPSSLKEILSDRMKLKATDIVLNEGLKKITNNCFYGETLDSLNIPSTLKDIIWDTSPVDYGEKIKITNLALFPNKKDIDFKYTNLHVPSNNDHIGVNKLILPHKESLNWLTNYNNIKLFMAYQINSEGKELGSGLNVFAHLEIGKLIIVDSLEINNVRDVYKIHCYHNNQTDIYNFEERIIEDFKDLIYSNIEHQNLKRERRK